MTRSNTIESIVRGVCIREESILLAYMKSDEYYFLPGGHIEQEESLYKALERELKEEAGVIAKAKELALIFEHAWEGKEGIVHEINFLVTCDVEEEVVNSNEPHLEFRWLLLSELDSVRFMPKEITAEVQAMKNGIKEIKFLSTLV